MKNVPSILLLLTLLIGQPVTVLGSLSAMENDSAARVEADHDSAESRPAEQSQQDQSPCGDPDSDGGLPDLKRYATRSIAPIASEPNDSEPIYSGPIASGPVEAGQRQHNDSSEREEDAGIGLSPPPCPWMVAKREAVAAGTSPGQVRSSELSLAGFAWHDIAMPATRPDGGCSGAISLAIRLLATELRPHAPPHMHVTGAPAV